MMRCMRESEKSPYKYKRAYTACKNLQAWIMNWIHNMYVNKTQGDSTYQTTGRKPDGQFIHRELAMAQGLNGELSLFCSPIWSESLDKLRI